MSTARAVASPGRVTGPAKRRPSRAARARELPGRALLAGSAAAWLGVLALSLSPALSGGASHRHGVTATTDSTVQAAPGHLLSWEWLGGWTLMVVAMMWPLLLPVVDRVSRAAFPRWRWRLVGITVATSTFLWLALGVAAALVADVFGVAHGSLWWQLAFIGAAAVAWRSAARSRLLWECAKLPPIAPGGRRGALGAVRFGVVSWRRCVLLCGPLMIAMVVGHNPVVMIAASLAVWWEAWHPRAWRDRMPLALIVVAGLGAVGGGLLA